MFLANCMRGKTSPLQMKFSFRADLYVCLLFKDFRFSHSVECCASFVEVSTGSLAQVTLHLEFQHVPLALKIQGSFTVKDNAF